MGQSQTNPHSAGFPLALLKTTVTYYKLKRGWQLSHEIKGINHEPKGHISRKRHTKAEEGKR